MSREPKCIVSGAFGTHAHIKAVSGATNNMSHVGGLCVGVSKYIYALARCRLIDARALVGQIEHVQVVEVMEYLS